MTKGNKVLEALEKVRERIDEEVICLKGFRLYDATGVDKVLKEEIDKTVREGEKKLKMKRMEDK